MGLVAGKAAKKDLEKAYTNRAEAVQIAAQLNTASLQCETIRRRTCVFYNLLARLDSYFMPLIYQMNDIVKAEGEEYVTGVTIAEVDDHFQFIPGTEKHFDVDTICLAVGLSPMSQL